VAAIIVPFLLRAALCAQQIHFSWKIEVQVWSGAPSFLSGEW